MKFAPSGSLFCLNHYLFKDDLNGNGNSEIYQFNSELGKVSYLYSTNTIRLPISCEFSNDENNIYIYLNVVEVSLNIVFKKAIKLNFKLRPVSYGLAQVRFLTLDYKKAAIKYWLTSQTLVI